METEYDVTAEAGRALHEMNELLHQYRNESNLTIAQEELMGSLQDCAGMIAEFEKKVRPLAEMKKHHESEKAEMKTHYEFEKAEMQKKMEEKDAIIRDLRDTIHQLSGGEGQENDTTEQEQTEPIVIPAKKSGKRASVTRISPPTKKRRSLGETTVLEDSPESSSSNISGTRHESQVSPTRSLQDPHDQTTIPQANIEDLTMTDEGAPAGNTGESAAAAMAEEAPEQHEITGDQSGIIEGEMVAMSLEDKADALSNLFHLSWVPDENETYRLNMMFQRNFIKNATLDAKIAQVDAHCIGQFGSDTPIPRGCMFKKLLGDGVGPSGPDFFANNCKFCKDKGNDRGMKICVWAQHVQGVETGFPARVNGRIISRQEGVNTVATEKDDWIKPAAANFTRNMNGRGVRWILYKRQWSRNE